MALRPDAGARGGHEAGTGNGGAVGKGEKLRAPIFAESSNKLISNDRQVLDIQLPGDNEKDNDFEKQNRNRASPTGHSHKYISIDYDYDSRQETEPVLIPLFFEFCNLILKAVYLFINWQCGAPPTKLPEIIFRHSSSP